jgi:hypothetical protein
MQPGRSTLQSHQARSVYAGTDLSSSYLKSTMQGESHHLTISSARTQGIGNSNTRLGEAIDPPMTIALQWRLGIQSSTQANQTHDTAAAAVIAAGVSITSTRRWKKHHSGEFDHLGEREPEKQNGESLTECKQEQCRNKGAEVGYLRKETLGSFFL